MKPGQVVVDIGTGVGLLAVFACRYGARKVYAIESDEAIELAKQVAKDNGCAAQIEFIRDHSTNVKLPEKADVIVSDVHGALPFHRRGLESLIDARHRFLAPGGTMIPLRDRIWTAAVDLPAKSCDQITIWEDRRWGVDLSAGRRFGVDCTFSARLQPENLNNEPVCIATLDYLTLESPSVCAELHLRAARDGESRGYVVWWDSDLAEIVPLTTAPGQPASVFPHWIAPWSRPVRVCEADQIEGKICFRLVHDDYVWTWNTCVRAAGGELKDQFRQSSLNCMFVTTEKLRKRTSQCRPRLQKTGEAGRAILDLMDGERTLLEIARTVMQRHPGVFADEKAALQAVAELSEKYSE
ncbi:MAG: 50S ribosomal protein L11 methyltransferase [Acidobacteriia bacterium]|nr:50S ribosomal protein L11 methyltransferase [Terriglobia bacterium]